MYFSPAVLLCGAFLLKPNTMNSFESLTDDELHRQLQRSVQALPDAPLHLQRAAIGLWPAAGLSRAPGLVAMAQAVLTQISAVLSFDSWAVPAVAAGMRSLRSPTRHLLYSAQGRDIDLRISPNGTSATAGFVLAGQILGPDETGSVQLTALQDGKVGPAITPATHLTQLDEMGEFRIEDLAPGSYALTLQVGGDAIVLPPLHVGGPEIKNDSDRPD
jgi:hypothetical protein